MGLRLIVSSLILFTVSLQAAVEISVESGSGLAWVKYQCTEGEVIRGVAIDVTVDRGRILGVSDFFVGQSTALAQGYGIFPSSFCDHVSLGDGKVDWEAEGYSPVASAAVHPFDTLPGIGTGGVTLEFGGLWDPSDPAAVPGPTGILCALRLSEGATVHLKANASRGGVVLSTPNRQVVPTFTGAFVQPPEIKGLFEVRGLMAVDFAGGELQKASHPEGPWIGTGHWGGVYAEFIHPGSKRFYRVSSH